MKIIIIAATDENNGIGINDNSIPWKESEDLLYFKERTINKFIILGRKTAIPLINKLKNRKFLILSKTLNEENEKCVYFSSIDNILSFIKKQKEEEIFVAGGSEIYSLFMDIATNMEISRIKGNYNCNKYFPKIDTQKWNLTKIINKNNFNIEIFEKN